MTNKFHHLRTATVQDNGSKRCPWPGCLCTIPAPLYMCKDHWNQLPKPIQRLIWDAYEVGQEADERLVSDEYRDSDRAARNWVNSYLAATEVTPPAESPGPAAGRPRDPS